MYKYDTKPTEYLIELLISTTKIAMIEGNFDSQQVQTQLKEMKGVILSRTPS